MSESWFIWGSQIILAMQHWGYWLTGTMKFFSFLGTEEFFLLAFPFIYWCLDAYLGMRIGTALLISTALNAGLKMALHTPRPFWHEPAIRGYEMAGSFGAPSGHAQVAATVWGMAAHEIKVRWFRWLAVAIIVLIGISRLFLGVHFPHDVLLGWLLGGLVLWGVLALWPRISRHLAEAGPGHRIAAAGLGSFLLFFVSWLPWYLQRNVILPFEWSINAGFIVTPISLNTGLTSAGVFFGFFLGHVLAKPLNFQPQSGSWMQKILRYLAGMAVLFIIWYILGLFFPRGATFSAWVLRYLRYLLIGLWISYGAPKFFAQLNLR